MMMNIRVIIGNWCKNTAVCCKVRFYICWVLSISIRDFKKQKHNGCVYLCPAETTEWRRRLRRATTPPSAVGRITVTLAHTCLTTLPHILVVRRPRRLVQAVRDHECQMTARGPRQTAGARHHLWDATKRGRPQRSSLCSDHTHS